MENEGLNQNEMVSSDNSSAASVATMPAAPIEKSLPQSQVDSIVGREKSVAHDKGYEKGKREALEEYQRQQTYQSQSSQPSLPSNGSITQEDFRRIAAEEAQKLQAATEQRMRQEAQEGQVQQFVREFDNKMNAGRAKYDDFDSVLGSIDLSNAGNVAVLAQSLDNTADVMYELAKNRPQDLVAFEQLAKMHPLKAGEAMRKLSESIKVNQTAAQMRRPNEPLSQISSSNTGIDSGSEHGMSTSDFRKMRY